MHSEHDNDVGSTHNGKPTTRWAINAEWAVHGSMGTDLLAPPIGQVRVAQADFSNSSFNVSPGKTVTVSDRRVGSDTSWDVLGQYQVTWAVKLYLGLIKLTHRKPPLSFYTSTAAVWGVNSLQPDRGNLANGWELQILSVCWIQGPHAYVSSLFCLFW